MATSTLISTQTYFYCDFDGFFSPAEIAEYEFSCSVASTAKVFVDDQLVVDNATKQKHGDSFFGSGTVEERGSINWESSKTYHIHVEFGTLPTRIFESHEATAFGVGGIRLGCYRKIETKVEL